MSVGNGGGEEAAAVGIASTTGLSGASTASTAAALPKRDRMSDRGLQKGFESCVAVRYKDLKWIGETGKVYRCVGTRAYDFGPD